MRDISKIQFKVLDKMRYDDVGDYKEDTIYSYNFKNLAYRNAVMLHEFIEYMLLDAVGISWETMDIISMNPELRKQYPKECKAYDKAHKMATQVEKEYLKRLGINWKKYDDMMQNKEVSHD